MSFLKTISNLLFWMITFCLIFSSGCSKYQSQSQESFYQSTQVSKLDHLGQTTDYIFNLQQFEYAEFEEKVSSGLNRWTTTDADKIRSVDWVSDPLIEGLNPNVKEVAEGLPSKNFNVSDAHFLKAATWHKSIADRIANESANHNAWPPLSETIKEMGDPVGRDVILEALRTVHPELDDDQSMQLAKAFKIFDWTIRNIQLEETLSWPNAETVNEEKLFDNTGSSWPPTLGVPGPGYQRFIWQSMMYSLGDSIERARIFIQIARHADLDVVMLATDVSDSEEDGIEYRTWLPAVLIGDNLYLFDSRLGLPIPGKDGRIATLADVVADPNLVDSLDLSVDESTSEDSNYWFDSSKLSGDFTALIDAPPESLSFRMKQLEGNLTGDQRLKLTIEPSEIASEIEGIKHIDKAVLWSVPMMTHQYRAAIDRAKREASFDAYIRDKIEPIMQIESYIDYFVRFRTGKNHYYMGNLKTPRQAPENGAIQRFTKMRYAQDLIDQVESNTGIMGVMGIGEKGQSAMQQQMMISRLKKTMELVRADSTYFVAMCHYELANPSTALNWLNRVKEFDDRGQWETGIRYLSGRAHETLDQIDDAIKIYQTGKNAEKLAPQTHGNLIRARLLNSMSNSENSND